MIDPYSYKKTKKKNPVTFITLNKQRDSRMCFNTKDKSSLKRDCSVSTSLLSTTHKSHAPVNMTPGHLKYGLKDLTSIPVYAVSYKESSRNGLYLNFSPIGTRSLFTCITRSTRAMWFTYAHFSQYVVCFKDFEFNNIFFVMHDYDQATNMIK